MDVPVSGEVGDEFRKGVAGVEGGVLAGDEDGRTDEGRVKATHVLDAATEPVADLRGGGVGDAHAVGLDDDLEVDGGVVVAGTECPFVAP